MKKKPQLRREDLLVRFGKNLSAIRKKAGMSQETLALKAGVSPSSIARIEKGSINTTISTAMHLAEKLGVSYAELFEH